MPGLISGQGSYLSISFILFDLLLNIYVAVKAIKRVHYYCAHLQLFSLGHYMFSIWYNFEGLV